jgi:hypothetical protein
MSHNEEGSQQQCIIDIAQHESQWFTLAIIPARPPQTIRLVMSAAPPLPLSFVDGGT